MFVFVLFLPTDIGLVYPTGSSNINRRDTIASRSRWDGYHADFCVIPYSRSSFIVDTPFRLEVWRYIATTYFWYEIPESTRIIVVHKLKCFLHDFIIKNNLPSKIFYFGNTNWNATFMAKGAGFLVRLGHCSIWTIPINAEDIPDILCRWISKQRLFSHSVANFRL